MLGSFVSAGLFAPIGLTLVTGPAGLVVGLLLTLVIAMIACGSLNVMIERVAYRPLRNAPKLAPLITAVGFSFILQNVGLLWRGGSPASVPNLIRAQQEVTTVFGVVIQRADLLAILVTIPLVIGMITFINQSRLGKAMRATAQDPDAARLQGINVDTTISVTFLIGGMLAGAAGLMFALYQTTIWFFQGFQAGLIAFTAAVMGGIGNLKGAVLGGLIIGVIQQISDNRIGTEWTPAIVFAYLVLIMVFRPRACSGNRRGRRDDGTAATAAAEPAKTPAGDRRPPGASPSSCASACRGVHRHRGGPPVLLRQRGRPSSTTRCSPSRT
jgi:branched-chain amino acid transport system permease protein